MVVVIALFTHPTAAGGGDGGGGVRVAAASSSVLFAPGGMGVAVGTISRGSIAFQPSEDANDFSS